MDTAPPQLTHIALHDGRTARVPPPAEDDEVIEQLRPIVSDGAGAVPLFEGWFLDVRPLRAPDGAQHGTAPGGAYLQISEQPPPSSEPAIMAVACWADGSSEDCWQQADAVYRALRPALAAAGLWRAPPRRPPPVPWVVTWLTPHATQADPAVLHALGAVERAAAWALIAEAGRR